jgi:hypothetical protein
MIYLLAGGFSVAMPLSPDDILTPSELASRLKVRTSWIYEKTRDRQRNPIPCFHIGRYLRFSWPDICSWLETTRTGHVDTTSRENGRAGQAARRAW